MRSVRTLLVVSVTGALTALSAYAVASTVSAAEATGAPVTGATGRCLDVDHGRTRNGTAVRLWDCNQTRSQLWTAGADGTMQALGRCLDVRFSGTANNTPVRLWQCNGSAAQVWRPTASGALVNPRSKRCLDVAASPVVRGTRVQIRDCDGSAGQQWRSAAPAPGGTPPSPTAQPTTQPPATQPPSPQPPSTRPPTTQPATTAPATKPPDTAPPATPPPAPLPPVTPPGGNFTVTINADSSKAPDLAGWLRDQVAILQEWYPRIAAILRTDGRTVPTTFSVTIDPGYTGVAYASGNRIVASADYIRKRPNDTGMLVHEAVHVMQQNKNGPGWFIEGSADYIRYFHYQPGTIRAPGKGSSYKNGYGTAAWFLNYVATTYDADIVAKVLDASRRGAYKESMWTSLTGKTVDALWDEMPKR
jgi:hypothetical protein